VLSAPVKGSVSWRNGSTSRWTAFIACSMRPDGIPRFDSGDAGRARRLARAAPTSSFARQPTGARKARRHSALLTASSPKRAAQDGRKRGNFGTAGRWTARLSGPRATALPSRFRASDRTLVSRSSRRPSTACLESSRREYLHVAEPAAEAVTPWRSSAWNRLSSRLTASVLLLDSTRSPVWP
jgi:hypothetical protein